MNDNGHSQNSIKVPCCVRRLDRTSAAMATVLETSTICHFAIMWFKRKLQWYRI